MKIAILGCGAVGSLYAARFSQDTKNEILCVVGSESHADRINNEGIEISDSKGSVLISARPRALTDTSGETAADLVLISVKSHSTLRAVKQHSSLFGPDTIALTLQNGYGNHNDILSLVDSAHLVMGTTAMGVNIRPDGQIILAGNGKTVIGSYVKGNPLAARSLETASQLLTNAGFEVEITEDAEDAILRKLLINVGINAVCTLNDRQNHFICDDQDMRDRSRSLVYEAVEVINQAADRDYSSDDIWNLVLSVAEKTGANVCSMLQDARNGRQTEIDKINGAIVELAASCRMQAPANTQVVKDILTMNK